MLTGYRPGIGLLHRMPAGPKLLVLLAIVLGVSLLPSTWWATGVAAATTLACYALAGLGDGLLGLRELARTLVALRWVLLVTLAGQLIFLGPEAAVTNTSRVAAAVAIAGLLMLTTPVAALLTALERGLAPLAFVRIDPQRLALLLAVTLTTIPVLARIAGQIREAQRARGARGGLATFAVPFLVMALKHADELGDALTARGVR